MNNQVYIQLCEILGWVLLTLCQSHSGAGILAPLGRGVDFKFGMLAFFRKAALGGYSIALAAFSLTMACFGNNVEQE